MGHTYTKTLFVVYMKFKFHWGSCIFLCSIWHLWLWGELGYPQEVKEGPEWRCEGAGVDPGITVLTRACLKAGYHPHPSLSHAGLLAGATAAGGLLRTFIILPPARKLGGSRVYHAVLKNYICKSIFLGFMYCSLPQTICRNFTDCWRITSIVTSSKD